MENNTPFRPQSTTNKILRSVLFIGSTSVAIILVCGAYFTIDTIVTKNSTNILIDQISEKKNKNRIDPSQLENIGMKASYTGYNLPVGHLVFSAVEKETEDIQRLQTYSIDIANPNSPPLNQSSIFDVFSSSFIEFNNVVNPTKLLFNALTFPDSEEATTSPEYFTYLFDTSVPSSGRVFESSDRQDSVFAWSETSNKIAYTVYRGDLNIQREKTRIADWDITLSSLDTQTPNTTIEGAMHPEWSPDGTKLIYLKEDGLYMYDVAVATENKIYTLKSGHSSGDLHINTMVNVSPDGEYLILTTEGTGRIELYKIISWEPFEIEILGRIVSTDSSYAWPVFSPDSQFYAVRTFDFDRESEKLINQRIEIRAIESRDVLSSFLYDNFISGLFIDDWIAKLPGE